MKKSFRLSFLVVLFALLTLFLVACKKTKNIRFVVISNKDQKVLDQQIKRADHLQLKSGVDLFVENDTDLKFQFFFKSKSKTEESEIDVRVDTRLPNYDYEGFYQDKKLTKKLMFPVKGAAAGLKVAWGQDIYIKAVKHEDLPTFEVINNKSNYPNITLENADIIFGIDELPEFKVSDTIKGKKQVLTPNYQLPVGKLTLEDCFTDATLKAALIAQVNEKGYVYAGVYHNFNADWGEAGNKGTFKFKYQIMVLKKNHLNEVALFINTINATFQHGPISKVRLHVPVALTYYIDYQKDTDFDVLEFCRAVNTVTGDNIAITSEHIDQSSYNLTKPGLYEVLVSVPDDDGILSENTIRLSVRNKVEGMLPIPSIEELKSKTQDKPLEITLWHSNGDTMSTILNFHTNGSYKKNNGDDDTKTKPLIDALEDSADIKSFEELMRAEGINVKVKIQKNGNNYDELLKLATSALSGSELPDLIQGYPDHVYGYNKGGYVQDLAPYIYDKHWGFGRFGGRDISAQEKDYSDIYSIYREEQTVSNNQGRILSLPFQKSTEIVIYNKDLYKQAGINEFPKTWGDLMDVAPKLIEAKNSYLDSFPSSFENFSAADAKKNFVPYIYDSSGNAFIMLAKQFGAGYTSRIDGKGSADFLTDTNVITMLKTVGSWAQKGYLSNAKKWETQYSSDKFKVGMSSMIISSSGGIGYNIPVDKNNVVAFEAEIAELPYKDKNNRNYMQQGPSFSIIKPKNTTEDTPYKQLVAWLYLKHLTSVQMQSHLARITGYSPVRKSVNEQPIFQAFLEKASKLLREVSAEEARQVMVAKCLKVVKSEQEHMTFDIPFVGSTQCRNEVGIIYERILFPGNKALDDVISEALETANNNLQSVVK